MLHTKDNIIQLVRDNGIKFIRMQFTDVLGQLKNVTITDNQTDFQRIQFHGWYYGLFSLSRFLLNLH